MSDFAVLEKATSIVHRRQVRLLLGNLFWCDDQNCLGKIPCMNLSVCKHGSGDSIFTSTQCFWITSIFEVIVLVAYDLCLHLKGCHLFVVFCMLENYCSVCMCVSGRGGALQPFFSLVAGRTTSSSTGLSVLLGSCQGVLV